MKRKYPELSMLLMSLFLLISCSLANAATLKFTYTSDTDGYAGFFTVDETTFNQKLGKSNWLLNEYISELSFSFRGDVWGTEDIDRKAYTVFRQVAGIPLPQVQGGSGALATHGFPLTNITLYADGIVNFADTFQLVQGQWSTSYVAQVPEPKGYALLLGGLLLIAACLRVKI
ncbi:hypothetical protein [Methylophilus sp.]|uniref:hypothetical protein n=1 Tax=Methylophilus sp. TaxID=29541 RepID=UPI0040372622